MPTSKPFQLTVLNFGGRDPLQEFPEGAGSPEDPGHAPVNFHAYAACTRGLFADRVYARFTAGTPVLLLLRRDLKACERALRQLLGAGCRVSVSLKETGSSQVAALLAKPGMLEQLRAILALAHGAIAATPDLVPFYRGLLPPGRDPACVQFIPTPYPVGEPGWDLSQPLTERRGLFIGTREFETPSRGHLAALTAVLPLARELNTPVTVFNTDGGLGAKMLAALDYPAGLLKIHTGRRAYPDYLRELAQHRLVFQFDASHVPGQVAGDALLTGLPCLGGNGAVDTLAFPDLCGGPHSATDLLALTRRLLTDDDFHAAEVVKSRRFTEECLAFPVVAQLLEAYFAALN